jgi:hypothetical protein
MHIRLSILALLLAGVAFAQNNPPSGGGGSGCNSGSSTNILVGNGSGGCTGSNVAPGAVSGTLGTAALQPTSNFLQPANNLSDVSGVQASRHNIGVHLGCGTLDHAICTSSVDGSGNPNFLTTAAGVALPINGGTTPLVLYIGGAYQVLSTNVTLTVPSTNNVQQWILVLQDLTNCANGTCPLVAADFLAMNTAPFYQYTAPTCPSPSPALSSTNPSFWFNLATATPETCTSNGGAYSTQVSMVLGTIFVDATPKVLQVLCEPYRLSPYMRYQLFGSGADGVLTITSGTTTIDTHKQYQSVLMTAGTLNHSQMTAAGGNINSVGVSLQSQSPVMIIGTGAINVNVLARSASAVGTGAGTTGSAGSLGGSGGGGGGSGSTSAAGGAGGGKLGFSVWVALSGGSQGLATPTAGGNGSSAQSPQPPENNFSLACAGAGGGNGAGDATNNGGIGGIGGGSVFLKAPSLFVLSTASITANAGNGATGAGGNAAGGGGGGGGCIVLNAGFLSVSGATITASNGTGGAKFGAGSGTAGGNGGSGLVQQNKLW